MKYKNHHFNLPALLVFVAVTHSPAAEITKSATGTNLADSASWGGTPLTPADTASWTGASLGAGMTVDTTAMWGGIKITGALTAIDVSGAAPIVLGSGGVNMGGSSVDASFSNPFSLTANQTWQAATGRTLTASGNISGTGDLTFGNLAVSQTTTTFLTTTAQTLFTNASLAQLVSTSGKMGGAWVNGGIPLAGNGYLLNNNGTTATYWLEVIEGTYTKGVKIELAQSGADITARALSAKYITTQNLGYDFNTGGTAGTVATSQGAGGYGANTTTLKFGYDAAGTIVLSGTNTYTGGTQIAAGTLRISGGAAIPDASSVTLASGTLDLQNNETIGSLGGTAGTVALNSNALTAGANNGSSSFAGAFTGTSGSLVKTGAGTLTLNGGSGNGGAVGSVVVDSGTLVLDGAAVPFNQGYFTGTTPITVKPGATLNVSKDWNISPTNPLTVEGGAVSFASLANYANNLTLRDGANAGGAWRVGHNSGSTVAGQLISTGDATNTVSGTVNLVKFPSAASHVWTVNVADGAAAKDLKITGNIVDSPGLPAGYAGTSVNKTGAGTLVIEGAANTYSGATTVNAGTLLVNGALGNSAVSVNGGTLGGGGTIGSLGGGSVTVLSGASLSPGNSIGTLTIDGSLTLAGSSDFEISPNDLADLVTVSGILNFGGSLNVTNIGGELGLGNSFNLFDWGTTSGTFASINLPALSDNTLSWDTSKLYTTGVVSIIPEPAVSMLGVLGVLGLLRRRR